MRYFPNTGIIKIFLFSFSILHFSSCASGSSHTMTHRSQQKDSSLEQKMRVRIVDFARKFEHLPYKKGGKTERGFDCSGFVYYVLKNFDIEMACSAQEQCKEGKTIELDQVKSGDLIFFGDKSKIHHVGIVTERQKNALFVIHSSSSNGVIEENVLQSDYWLKRIKSFKDLNSYRPVKLAAFK